MNGGYLGVIFPQGMDNGVHFLGCEHEVACDCGLAAIGRLEFRGLGTRTPGVSMASACTIFIMYSFGLSIQGCRRGIRPRSRQLGVVLADPATRMAASHRPQHGTPGRTDTR